MRHRGRPSATLTLIAAEDPRTAAPVRGPSFVGTHRVGQLLAKAVCPINYF
jgi:hypothetical protein